MSVWTFSWVWWTAVFKHCTNIDEYATRLTNIMYSSVASCTSVKSVHRHERLPKHVVHLLRVKRKAWVTTPGRSDRRSFVVSWNTIKAPMHSHRRNQERRLVHSKNKIAFFFHVYKKINAKPYAVNITVNGNDITDQQAALFSCISSVANFLLLMYRSLIVFVAFMLEVNITRQILERF